MNRKEIREYFDVKFRSLHKDIKIGEKRKRKESEFKFKSNRKQFEFNCDIKEDIEELLELVEVGSKKISS